MRTRIHGDWKGFEIWIKFIFCERFLSIYCGKHFICSEKITKTKINNSLLLESVKNYRKYDYFLKDVRCFMRSILIYTLFFSKFPRRSLFLFWKNYNSLIKCILFLAFISYKNITSRTYLPYWKYKIVSKVKWTQIPNSKPPKNTVLTALTLSRES